MSVPNSFPTSCDAAGQHFAVLKAGFEGSPIAKGRLQLAV